jgi:sugar/nucleoside kinase (ribokinase family)
MTDRIDVIGIGHVTCDIVCPVSGWPERDTKTVIPGITFAGGGPAANALAAAARLGLSTALVGRLGDDVLGRYTLGIHEQAGIDVSRLVIDPRAVSPVSVIISDLEDATRTILLTKGELTAIEPADLDWEWLQSARLIYLDGHQLPASLAVAREARHWPGVMVMLDAGSMREGMLELCACCDLVIASRAFARQLTGATEATDSLRQLRDMGVQVAAVTLGSAGSVGSDSNGTVRVPAYQVTVRDTTGAGDAYHGGFVYGWLAGCSLPECMRIASAVAALKCTGFGARERLPDRRQLVEFMENAGSLP